MFNETDFPLSPLTPLQFPQPPIYALVIGINAYTSARYQPLKSAVSDADTFETFLVTKLGVSHSRVLSIRDGEATRKGILEGFEKLRKMVLPKSSSTYSNSSTGKWETDLDMNDSGDVAMIVYFAGHGARVERPPEWSTWLGGEAERREGTLFMEALCPVDLGEYNEELGCEVPPIPDRTVAALLRRLSETRGNNITLILDCCHSAGINRGDASSTALDEGYTPRRIFDPPPISPSTDEILLQRLGLGLSDTNRGTEISDSSSASIKDVLPGRGFVNKSGATHVLLAACGKDQVAYEHPTKPNGVFTWALMKILNGETGEDVRELTYEGLMHRLNMPDWQNAHCEGAHTDRRLFNHLISGSDKTFILGTLTKSRPTIKLEASATTTVPMMKLEAGLAQGITAGSQFTVHATNLLPLPWSTNQSDTNPELGKVVVRSAEMFFSELEFVPGTSSFKVPKLFYCRLVHRSNTEGQQFLVASNVWTWLEQTVDPMLRENTGVTLTKDLEAADMVFTLEEIELESKTELEVESDEGCGVVDEEETKKKEKLIYIDHKFPTASEHLGTRSPFTIEFEQASWMVPEVLKCAVNFRYHLTRGSNPNSSEGEKLNVTMELHELETSYDENFALIKRPVGEDIFNNRKGGEPGLVVVDENKKYGISIQNRTDLGLYPYLFYFDPSEFSITPWYIPPIGTLAISNTNTRVDIPLAPLSELPIGYGSTTPCDETWEFLLREGEDKDIGFFKMFLTTRPVAFGSIMQECPFYFDKNERGVTRSGRTTTQIVRPVIDVWGSVCRGVVQISQ